MKFVDEYRGEAEAQQLVRAIERTVTKPWTLMEICGGQTHTLVKYGIDNLLPKLVTLVHGPGCPVCVTPLALIDHAIELARRPRSSSPPLAICCVCPAPATTCSA